MKFTPALLATTILSTSLLFLTACNDTTTAEPDTTEALPSNASVTAVKDDIIAHVNNAVITKAALQNAINERSKDGEAPASGLILQEMINLEILKQEGIKQGLDQDPIIKAEINRLTTAVIANALIKNQFKDLTITEEQTREEYNNQIAKLPQNEYKASHILLKNEADALAVIVDLNNGGLFTDLAKEKSTGPSGKNGGDLGWFQANTMVAEFATAVKTMEKDSYSTDPVKTQFGYHVIHLVDSRVLPGPAYEDVKDKIKTIIVNTMLKNYVESITQSATIEIVEPKNEPKTLESIAN